MKLFEKLHNKYLQKVKEFHGYKLLPGRVKMVILRTFVYMSRELNVTGAVGSSFLTYERDKSNGSQNSFKTFIFRELGPNTLYLHSEPRTPLYSLVSRKSAIVIDGSFQSSRLEQWIKLNVSPYLGDWAPYYGDWDTFSNFGNSSQKSPFWYISV